MVLKYLDDIIPTRRINVDFIASLLNVRTQILRPLFRNFTNALQVIRTGPFGPPRWMASSFPSAIHRLTVRSVTRAFRAMSLLV